MQGFPPSPDKRVSHENQLLAPYNRWSFQNELQLNRTADVWRGSGPAAQLEANPLDLRRLTYPDWTGQLLSFDDMVETSYTDGIVVLHQGKIIYERYLNGMEPHTLHAWASASKSMTGVLAATLAAEGIIDEGEKVSFYVPELAGSGFGDATVRQVMDMTTAVRFPKEDSTAGLESLAYGIALGWAAPPDGYDGPASAYEFLPTMSHDGRHGLRFAYLTPNTDVLAWILKRRLNQTLAAIMQQQIWTNLGAERDAFWIVDSASAETAGSGLISTTRDMARFGQMMLDKGFYNGRQIIPTAIAEEIQKGGDSEAFTRGPAASPLNRGWSYRSQWWVTHNKYSTYIALGYGGQMLYITPAVQMVVAKMSSYPTPTPAGNEFYSAFSALSALAAHLADS